jgi:DNA-binding winged helix-turn-helix (wHTH) protein/Tol biopolymer transport system component
VQVLTVLVHADGAVVSRDELIQQCWGGRAVSEDSINRSIAKIRQLAVFGGSKAFEIETIARVGYRLIEKNESAAALSVAPVAPAPARPQASITVPIQKNRPSVLIVLVVVAVIALAAAAVVGFHLFIPNQPRIWEVTEAHQPFISTLAPEITPAISRNGTMIAYAAGPDFNHLSIYLRLRAGGDPARLTTADTAYEPAWSPDDSTIAYMSNVPGQRCRIMLVAALGGSPREVGRCRNKSVSGLAWSGNGLFYTDAAAPNLPGAIYRLDLDSGITTPLTHPIPEKMSGDDGPVISPDGKTLAFIRTIHYTLYQIILHNLATGAERVLLESRDLNDSAAWAFDSSTLFVARHGSWDAALWAYPVSGAPPQRISTGPVPINGLSSGPDGLLAMELRYDQSDLAVAPASPNEPPVEFAQDGFEVNAQVYAPDGTLAVIASHSGELALYLAGPDRTLHELLNLKTDLAATGLNWSPDSARMAFIEGGPASQPTQDRSSDIAIDVVDRRGSLLRLPFHATETGWVAWINNTSLITAHRDQAGWRLWRINLAHPYSPIPLPQKGYDYPLVHDGMIFGVKDGQGGIWRIDGVPRKLTNYPTLETSQNWTLFRDLIVYADESNPQQPVYKALPMRGGPARIIGYPKALDLTCIPTVDPRTGLVTYVHIQRSDSDIGWIRLTPRH